MDLLRKYPFLVLSLSVVMIAAATAMGYRQYQDRVPAGIAFLELPTHAADSLLEGFAMEARALLRMGLAAQENTGPATLVAQLPPMSCIQGDFPNLLALASIPEAERRSLIQAWAHQMRLQGSQLALVQTYPCGGFPPGLLEAFLDDLAPLQEARLLVTLSIERTDCQISPETLSLLCAKGVSALYLSPEATGLLPALRPAFPGLILVEASANQFPQIRDLFEQGADLLMTETADPELEASLLMLAKEGFWEKEEQENSLKRQLLARQWCGFSPATPHPQMQQALKRQFAEASQILVKNQDQLLPFSGLKGKNFFEVTVGSPLPGFEAQLQLYAPFQQALLSRDETGKLPALPIEWLQQFDPVILALNDPYLSEKKDTAFFRSWHRLAQNTRIVVVNFGFAGTLLSFSTSPTLVQAMIHDRDVQDLPAQLLFGGVAARGRLPLTLGGQLKAGQGLTTPRTRMAYSLPEEIGMQSGNLSWIDSILQNGISEHALPGGQVLVAMGGRVIYHKAFGYHTYSQQKPVQLTDLYDIASITKVAGTTLAAMGMYEAGMLDLESELGTYFHDTLITLERPMEDVRLVADTFQFAGLPDSVKKWGEVRLPDSISASSQPSGISNHKPVLPADAAPEAHRWKQVKDSLWVYYRPEVRVISRSSNIFRVKIGELLTHHSGLPPAMPIQPYISYRDSGGSRFGTLYSPEPSDSFSLEVARDFYLRNDYRDSLWKAVKYLKRYPQPRYEYSDVNLVLLQMAIDSLNQLPISQYLEQRFYRGLGLQNTCYRPAGLMPLERVTPTAYDAGWRGQLLRGYVHDPTAALLGGVAGNAGLFSNANDLAILFQMLLNEGSYGGEQFLQPETIRKFTEVHAGHRGYGFDKLPSNGFYLVSSMSSRASYGHTGFTGTVIWVDPEYQLVYVFLSNRVHPSERNWRINTLGIRRQIHDVIYNSIGIGL